MRAQHDFRAVFGESSLAGSVNSHQRSIRYVGYYDVPANASENRAYFLSATNKMDYVASVLNELGLCVEIVSLSSTRNSRGYAGKTLDLGRLKRLVVFPSTPWGGRALRFISRLSQRLFLFLWLLRNVAKQEDILVYHSPGYAFEVMIAKWIRGFRLILEVEEVYSDVTGSRRLRNSEYRLFKRADAFVFPTELMRSTVNRGGKTDVVVYGTYRVEADRGCRFEDGRIHIIYAGTFDSRKGGASTAVSAAQFLDGRYHLHVIGFGSAADTRVLLGQIEAVTARTGCRVTYDGLLSGDDYIRFVQSCDIGLSTQSSTSAFNETSFPSKVLSYMANGLKVVSIRLKVLEESDVGDLLFFSETDSPEAIAATIGSIDVDAPYDSRARLTALDAAFAQALSRLLGE